MHFRNIPIPVLAGVMALTLLAGGCVKRVRDVELVGVTRVASKDPATPRLRIAFSSRYDLRGLRGQDAYLWLSLCPIREDFVVNIRELYLDRTEVKPGQDVPRRIDEDQPPLIYTSDIDYDRVMIRTDYEIDNYRLMLPPEAVDLCFRVESSGLRHFRSNDVFIPKTEIARALGTAGATNAP